MDTKIIYTCPVTKKEVTLDWDAIYFNLDVNSCDCCGTSASVESKEVTQCPECGETHYL